MTWFEAIGLINVELERARQKHPDWPADEVYQAAIVAEEAGELVQAALQHKRENQPYSAIEKEAIQTAATCLRLLIRC